MSIRYDRTRNKLFQTNLETVNNKEYLPQSVISNGELIKLDPSSNATLNLFTMEVKNDKD